MDPMGRVLLLRFAVTQNGKPFAFWATPGGGAAEDESDHAAAIRELAEELRLSVSSLDGPLDGPVHVHESTFEVNGTWWQGRDVFFHGRCAADAPVFTGGSEAEERAALQDMRWWTLEELDQTAETVFPPELATVARALLA